MAAQRKVLVAENKQRSVAKRKKQKAAYVKQMKQKAAYVKQMNAANSTAPTQSRPSAKPPMAADKFNANVKKGIRNAKPVQSTKVSSAQMKAMKAQRGPTAPTQKKFQSRPSAKPPWANRGNTGK
jgi:hypothetical protein